MTPYLKWKDQGIITAPNMVEKDTRKNARTDICQNWRFFVVLLLQDYLDLERFKDKNYAKSTSI